MGPDGRTIHPARIRGAYVIKNSTYWQIWSGIFLLGVKMHLYVCILSGRGCHNNSRACWKPNIKNRKPNKPET